jgi:hypothetical protein
MKFLRKIFRKPSVKNSTQQSAGRPFGSTDEEIKQFSSNWGQVIINDTTITFHNYPFNPSIAYGDKTFIASDIKNIDLESAPPTLQIGTELIFISAILRDKLKEFATKNNVPTIQQPRIWNWILEPFLDTEFTDENETMLNNILAQYGLTKPEISTIRSFVRDQMMKFNFDTMLWNWTGFSAVDVLFAMRPRLSDADFNIFYSEVMRIALLPGGHKIQATNI